MGVFRTDTGTVRGVQRTPQGGIRVDAAITRAGVFTYRDGAGNEWRELRHPDDVFAKDSLESLRDAAVTVGHPPGLVTAETWNEFSKGYAPEVPTRENALVIAPLTIQNADTVRAVESKELHEISAGYTCDVLDTPGVYDGIAYERRQTNIRYNHAALLPSGKGRAGSEVALRMDGAAVQVDAIRTDAAAPKTTPEKTMEIKFFGKTYRTDSEPDMAALATDAGTAEQSADKGEAEMAALKKALSDALVASAVLEAKLKAAEAVAAAAGEPDGDEEPVPEEVLDAALAVREALRADAKTILGDSFDPKGQKPEAIRAAVLAKISPSVKLDSVDAKLVPVVYDAAVAAYLANRPSNPVNDAIGAALSGVRSDATEAVAAPAGSAEEASQKMHKARFDASRAPLK